MDKLILSVIDLEELADKCAERSAEKTAELLKAVLSQTGGRQDEKELPTFLKPSKVQKYFDIGKDTVYKWVREGRINAYYPTGDCLVKVAELLELVESRKVAKIEKLKPLKKIS